MLNLPHCEAISELIPPIVRPYHRLMTRPKQGGQEAGKPGPGQTKPKLGTTGKPDKPNLLAISA